MTTNTLQSFKLRVQLPRQEAKIQVFCQTEAGASLVLVVSEISWGEGGKPKVNWPSDNPSSPVIFACASEFVKSPKPPCTDTNLPPPFVRQDVIS